MPSLPASIFGFAAGIANADKIDVVTSTHAARLIKSRRRIRFSFGRPRICGTTRMLCGPDCSQKCYLPPAPTLQPFRSISAERPVRSSRAATCIRWRRKAALRPVESAWREPCVRLILMVAIHIHDTNGPLLQPRPDDREFPKAESAPPRRRMVLARCALRATIARFAWRGRSVLHRSCRRIRRCSCSFPSRGGRLATGWYRASIAAKWIGSRGPASREKDRSGDNIPSLAQGSRGIENG